TNPLAPGSLAAYDGTVEGDQTGNGWDLRGPLPLPLGPTTGLVLPGGQSGISNGLVPPLDTTLFLAGFVDPSVLVTDPAADLGTCSDATSASGFGIRYNPANKWLTGRALIAAGGIGETAPLVVNPGEPFAIGFRPWTSVPAPVAFLRGNKAGGGTSGAIATRNAPIKDFRFGGTYSATPGLKWTMLACCFKPGLLSQGLMDAQIAIMRQMVLALYGVTIPTA
ncbi:MAG: hypothetical protein ACRC67_16275, partial [Inquilinus sp.]|uniref:hypothetical protein n=1 Tax=Inquilinus sp. TaxID=1932117 RepID=UPI003F3B4129